MGTAASVKRDQEVQPRSKGDTAKRLVDVLTVTFKSDYLFAVNSSTVLPGAYDELERVSKALTRYPETSIRIAGHTDSAGPVEYNQKLSERRAEALRSALVEMGVNPSRLTLRITYPLNPVRALGCRVAHGATREPPYVSDLW